MSTSSMTPRYLADGASDPVPEAVEQDAEAHHGRARLGLPLSHQQPKLRLCLLGDGELSRRPAVPVDGHASRRPGGLVREHDASA